MSNTTDNDNKTRRLDDDYFKNIATRAKSAPSGSDDDKTQIVGKQKSDPQPKSSGDKTDNWYRK